MAYSASFGSAGGGSVAAGMLERRAAPATPATAPTPTAAVAGGGAAPPANGLAGLGFLKGFAPPAQGFAPGSTDPAYLAYQRQLEYQRQIANLAAQRQLQNLAGQMVIGPEQLAAQGVIARRGISGSLESRGLFRSGERLRNLADERTAEAQKLAAIRLAGAGRYGDILTTLQGNLAGLSNTSADQALANQVRNTP